MKKRQSQMLTRMWKNWNSLEWVYKHYYHFLELCDCVLEKLKTYVPSGPCILLRGLPKRNANMFITVLYRMFLAILITAQKWKQNQYPSIGECWILIMDLLPLGNKKNELWTHTTTHANLKNSMLSNRSQTQMTQHII